VSATVTMSTDSSFTSCSTSTHDTFTETSSQLDALQRNQLINTLIILQCFGWWYITVHIQSTAHKHTTIHVNRGGLLWLSICVQSDE